MMRIGLWCAYGRTLEPSEGIGVFAHNLARAIAAIDGVDGVNMVVHRGDAPLVAPTVAAGRGKIAVVSLERLPWVSRWRWKSARRKHRRLSDRLAIGDVDGAEREKLERKRRSIERVIGEIFVHQRVSDPAAFRSCDVWLLPHVAVERTFSAARVVVVHDMVPLHVPGVVKAADLESFRRRSRRIVEDATLVATMSKTIRDVDIVGLLGCPVEKVRVVPPAIPDDFASAASRTDVIRMHPEAARPFLLYPAAYRPYKNHAGLFRAIAELDRRRHPPIGLILTGTLPMPDDLENLVRALGLGGRIHAIGTVDRAILAGLYREALATIVPSRYEQGSFPVLESLHWGCPVAASDIPALRESLSALGDTMLFFDPESPAAIADAVTAILKDREGIRSRQATAFEAMRCRTWSDVAAEWVAVFEEAIERHRRG